MSLAAALRAIEANPLALHIPTPGQEPFHKSGSRARLLRAPPQTGKTTAGAAECHWWSLGIHPHIETPSPPLRGRVVCYSWTQSLIIQAKVYDLLPDGVLHQDCTYHPDRGFKHGRLRYGNGSLVDFVTAEQSTIAVAGATLDWAWLDEPPPPEIYSETLSRLTATKGSCWLTLTPIGRPVDWLRAEVEAGRIEDHNFSLTPKNCPWLTQKDVNDVRRVTLESERPQRLEGAWEGVSPDRLFSAWSEDLLLGSKDDLPSRELGIGLAWDHGEDAGREYCLLFAYDRARRQAWLLDEYVSAGRTTAKTDAIGVLEMLDRHDISPYQIDFATGDTNSAGKSALVSVNRLIEEELARAIGQPSHSPPFRIVAARKGPGSVMWGCRVLNGAMARGAVKVSAQCERFLDGVRHWRGTKRGQDAELSHALDAARYGLAGLLDARTRGAGRIAVR